MSQRKCYAIVGTGARSGMFVNAITNIYREAADLVAFYNLNQTQMDWYNQKLSEMHNIFTPGRWGKSTSCFHYRRLANNKEYF